MTAQVALSDQWTSASRASFRGTIAGTLVGYLDPVPAADAGTGVELAEAGRAGVGQGGADRQWMTVTMYLYELGWGNQKSFGRAAAVAWILFLIILIIGMINFSITRRIASAGEISAKTTKKGARR